MQQHQKMSRQKSALTPHDRHYIQSMKKGEAYITISEATTPKHPIIKALKAKGINCAEVIYASHFSSNAGWDMVSCDKNLVGMCGWLGFTTKEALETIECMEVRDGRFLFIKRNNT